MKCENCKAEIPAGKVFCPECGTPVANPTQAAAMVTGQAIRRTGGQVDYFNTVIVIQFLIAAMIVSQLTSNTTRLWLNMAFAVPRADLNNLTSINLFCVIVVSLACLSRLFIQPKKTQRSMLLISGAIVLFGQLVMYAASATWFVIAASIISYAGLALLIFSIGGDKDNNFIKYVIGGAAGFLLAVLVNSFLIVPAFDNGSFRLVVMARAAVFLFLYILMAVMSGKKAIEPISNKKNFVISISVVTTVLFITWVIY